MYVFVTDISEDSDVFVFPFVHACRIATTGSLVSLHVAYWKGPVILACWRRWTVASHTFLSFCRIMKFGIGEHCVNITRIKTCNRNGASTTLKVEMEVLCSLNIYPVG